MHHTRVGQLVRIFLVVTIADSPADAGEASTLSDDPVKFVFFLGGGQQYVWNRRENFRRWSFRVGVQLTWLSCELDSS